jgi:hypothetical protein
MIASGMVSRSSGDGVGERCLRKVKIEVVTPLEQFFRENKGAQYQSALVP